MAPEVFHDQTYSESSDVFAFGIVLYELLMKTTPYKGLTLKTPHHFSCLVCHLRHACPTCCTHPMYAVDAVYQHVHALHQANAWSQAPAATRDSLHRPKTRPPTIVRVHGDLMPSIVQLLRVLHSPWFVCLAS